LRQFLTYKGVLREENGSSSVAMEQRMKFAIPLDGPMGIGYMTKENR
jgi:hypothetical protein